MGNIKGRIHSNGAELTFLKQLQSNAWWTHLTPGENVLPALHFDVASQLC